MPLWLGPEWECECRTVNASLRKCCRACGASALSVAIADKSREIKETLPGVCEWGYRDPTRLDKIDNC